MEPQDDHSPEEALKEYLRERVKRDRNASMAPWLCHHCRFAIDRSRILGPKDLDLRAGQKLQEDYPHVGDLTDLLFSATGGCPLCTVFSSTINPYLRVSKSYQAESRRKLTLRIECKAWGHSEQDGIQQSRTISVYRMTKVLDRKVEELLASRGVSEYNDIFQLEEMDRWSAESKARLSLWTGSEMTLGLAHDWLRHCLRNHPKCSKLKSYAMAKPSRLLKIGDIADDGSIRVHLVDTPAGRNENDSLTRYDTLTGGNITSGLQYCALSHRWPQKPIMKLTCENLERCQEGIAWADLSKTFQDAIITAQSLGFSYIWIDTLCIIQDSVEDWQRESAIMGDIYQGNVCTIACLDGEQPKDGCFRFRNPLHTYRCSLNKRFYLFPTISTQTTSWEIPSGELQTRGWVIQERALSPRTIYFGRDQIMWECGEATANEACPITRIGGRYDYTSPKLSFPLFEIESPSQEKPIEIGRSSQSDRLQYFEHKWTQLLQHYTDCDLTEPNDKLVALQGIIRKIEENCPLKSIAGLWQQLLPAQLLWYTTLSARHRSRPPLSPSRPYRAPSWSWAATDSPITSNFHRFNVFSARGKNGMKWRMQIQSIAVDALPNGQVRSGHLIASAPVRKISLSMLQNYTPLDDNIHHKPSQYRVFTMSSARTAAKYWNPDFGNVQDRDLYAVLAAQRDRFREPGPARKKKYGVFHDGRCNLGIVIRERGKGVFERVGYFEEHYWRHDVWPLFSTYRRGSVRTLKIV